jgi:hypothetical protein
LKEVPEVEKEAQEGGDCVHVHSVVGAGDIGAEGHWEQAERYQSVFLWVQDFCGGELL